VRSYTRGCAALLYNRVNNRAYIHLYIYRYIWIYIHTHIYIYIYIYIYTSLFFFFFVNFHSFSIYSVISVHRFTFDIRFERIIL